MPRHESYDATCDHCKTNAGELQTETETLWENDLWSVRHADAPYGIAGWLTLYAKRHFPGPSHFNADEASRFGPTLQKFEKTLLDITGALRIYTASWSEGFPHFHCHMFPRYANTPNDLKGRNLLLAVNMAKAGEIVIDPAEVASIEKQFKEQVADFKG